MLDFKKPLLRCNKNVELEVESCTFLFLMIIIQSVILQKYVSKRKSVNSEKV